MKGETGGPGVPGRMGPPGMKVRHLLGDKTEIFVCNFNLVVTPDTVHLIRETAGS